MADTDLLGELRLDRDAREGHAGGWRWPLGLILVLGALGGGAYYVLSSPTLTVEAAVAERPGAGPAKVLDATGYVIARRQATVSSKISGKLAEVLIEEGMRVEAGQILARLDDADARAERDLAQARLAAARSQLDQIQLQLEQAQRDLKRQEGLAGRRLTSEETVDNARTLVAVRTAQLAAQRSQVGVAEAQRQVAQVGYDNTIVHAPFAGVVVAKAAQPGEIVSPVSAGGGFTRTGIGTIVDMESLEIEVDVNEAFINRVRPGQAVEAVLDAYPEWRIPASVIAIIPTADRSKATVKVRIAIDQKDPRLLPEMGVRVSFLKDDGTGRAEIPDGVLVPASAILERGDDDLVYVLDGDRVRARKVTPGESLGDRRVVEGLAPGERVVRDPSSQLRDGGRVIVR